MVEARRRLEFVGRQLDVQAVAVDAELHFRVALVHVERVRDCARLDQRDAGNVSRVGRRDVDGGSRFGHHRHITLALQHRTLGTRTVGIEQVRRVVDLGVQVIDRPRLATARGQDGGVGQQQRDAVVETLLVEAGTRRELAGIGVEDQRLVVDLARFLVDWLFHIVEQVLGRTARHQHVAIGHNGGIAPHVGLGQRRQVDQLRLVTVDVDQRDRCLLGAGVDPAELEDQARTDHGSRRGGLPGTPVFPVFRAILTDAREVPVGAVHLHRALAVVAIRVDLVHEVRVETEDLAVGRDEVARVVVLEHVARLAVGQLVLRFRIDVQRTEGAIGLAQLGVTFSVGTALDIHLTGGQRGGGAVPARQRHLVAVQGQRTADRVEQVDILVALVCGAAILEQVTAQDQHAAVLQQDLGRAEQEGVGLAGQHHVGVVTRTQRRIPHVVAEPAARILRVVGAVGQHAAVGRQRGVNGHQRPVHGGRPHTFGFVFGLGGRCFGGVAGIGRGGGLGGAIVGGRHFRRHRFGRRRNRRDHRGGNRATIGRRGAGTIARRITRGRAGITSIAIAGVAAIRVASPVAGGVACTVAGTGRRRTGTRIAVCGGSARAAVGRGVARATGSRVARFVACGIARYRRRCTCTGSSIVAGNARVAIGRLDGVALVTRGRGANGRCRGIASATTGGKHGQHGKRGELEGRR